MLHVDAVAPLGSCLLLHPASSTICNLLSPLLLRMVSPSAGSG